MTPADPGDKACVQAVKNPERQQLSGQPEHLPPGAKDPSPRGGTNALNLVRRATAGAADVKKYPYSHPIGSVHAGLVAGPMTRARNGFKMKNYAHEKKW